MAQIPMTPGRSRMPGTPNLKLGAGMVTPEDLGSREFNEYGKLAQSIGHTGQAQMDWAIGKYNERAEAWARNTDTLYQEETNKYKAGLFSRQGEAAFNTEKELETFNRNLADKLTRDAPNPLAKEIFERQRAQYDSRSRVQAVEYTLGQHQNYVNTSLDAANNMLLRDAERDPGSVPYKIQNGFANIEKRYAGMSDEVKQNEKEKFATTMVSMAAKSLAVNPAAGPEQALAMLDDSDVNKYLTPPKLQALSGCS